MWESAVNDVGSKLKEAADGVDTASLGQHVNVIRQKSVGFVEDVSRNFQNINLNMNQSELSKRAEVISNSTKNLLDQASQTLQKSHQEALHIFVDADSSTSPPIPKPSVSPWDKAALPPSELQYADNLRQEMLKIVVDSIYSKKKRIALFLSDVANANNFKFNFDENSGMALAALDADTNMRRLRAGLVPGKMTEDAFWTVYFYHVHRVRQALVANNGVIPEPPVDEDDEDPAALFGNDDEEEELAALDSVAPANASSEQTFTNVKPSADGKRNWDDEIDAIFDDE